MTVPDSRDDTSTDDERFENALLAQDDDAAGITTADVDDARARTLVNELIDADVVKSAPEARILVHDPSGAAVDSPTQLVVFHEGWTAGCDAEPEEK